MSHDHDRADRSIDQNALEDLLALALQAHETGGDAAVDALVAANPAHAAALREALADLSTIDLLNGAPAEAPERLGEFRLRGTLGAGGMGIVYLAEQTSLGREVALKVVRPELLFFDGARERFRREIDAVARLEHPAIVPILATGIADGVPYYAMPRIHGRSAEAVLRAFAGRDAKTLHGRDLLVALAADAAVPAPGPGMPFDTAWWQDMVRLVHQAALGIAHAHARGVLHRDLKPSNLMLTADGRAIVLDFGLAVARGDARLTRTGTAAGSPAYMAPEQVRGERADERTDVYGLAATLHSLIDLHPPFSANDGEALKSQILAGARRRLAPGAAPVELRLVLDHAMDVEPGRRYGSAAAFAEDLQAVLEGKPIAARGLPVPVRLQRFMRRHRVLTTALTAMCLFVIVLPAVLLWQQREANELLNAQVQRANRSARVSVDAVQELLAAVARDRMRHVPEAQDIAAQMLRGAIALFDELQADATQAQRAQRLGLSALARLVEVEVARGNGAAAMAAARLAVARCGDGDLPPFDRLIRVDARCKLIGLLLDNRLDNEAQGVAETCLGDVTVLLQVPEHQRAARNKRAQLRSFAATLANRSGDRAAEERALRDAAEGFHDGDLLALATAKKLLATFLRQQRRAPEALPEVTEAVRIATSDGLPARGWPLPKFVEAHARLELGDTLTALGREADAVDAYRASFAAFEGFLHDYPESSARRGRGACANNWALILFRQQKWTEVRALLEGACADQLAVLARDPDDKQAAEYLGYHRQTLCSCLGKLGDLSALEPVARDLGRTSGAGVFALGAARGLLRCAAGAAEPERMQSLRNEAVELLVEADRRGAKIDFDDALFAPVRNEPRLAAIRDR